MRHPRADAGGARGRGIGPSGWCDPRSTMVAATAQAFLRRRARGRRALARPPSRPGVARPVPGSETPAGWGAARPRGARRRGVLGTGGSRVHHGPRVDPGIAGRRGFAVPGARGAPRARSTVRGPGSLYPIDEPGSRAARASPVSPASWSWDRMTSRRHRCIGGDPTVRGTRRRLRFGVERAHRPGAGPIPAARRADPSPGTIPRARAGSAPVRARPPERGPASSPTRRGCLRRRRRRCPRGRRASPTGGEAAGRGAADGRPRGQGHPGGASTRWRGGGTR